jgi:hypothetical protein
VSWAFLLKEINRFLMRSQIGRFLGLGLKNRCLFVLLRFLVIGLKLGVDVSKISSQHSQEPTCKVSSQSELFWSSFDPFFLGSCCCFWTAWSQRGTFGTRNLRRKTRSLRTCCWKIYVWTLRVLILRSIFCFDFLTSQESFSKYSCYRLAWVFWVENSLPLHRSWVSLFCPSV